MLWLFHCLIYKKTLSSEVVDKYRMETSFFPTISIPYYQQIFSWTPSQPSGQTPYSYNWIPVLLIFHTLPLMAHTNKGIISKKKWICRLSVPDYDNIESPMFSEFCPYTPRIKHLSHRQGLYYTTMSLCTLIERPQKSLIEYKVLPPPDFKNLKIRKVRM